MADTAPLVSFSTPDTADASSVGSDATSTALMVNVAPSHALAVGYQGLAHSLSLLMLGDTNAHQAFAATSNAIVAATVNLLIGSGASRD